MQPDNLIQIADRQRGHNVRDMLFVLVLLVMLAVGIAGWRAATSYHANAITPADDMVCAPTGQPAPSTLRRC